MSSLKSSLLLIALSALAGCASPPPVAYKPPQIPPLPPEIGTKREVNLTDRLTQLLMPNEQPSQPSLKLSPKGIGIQPSSTPALTLTKP